MNQGAMNRAPTAEMMIMASGAERNAPYEGRQHNGAIRYAIASYQLIEAVRRVEEQAQLDEDATHANSL